MHRVNNNAHQATKQNLTGTYYFADIFADGFYTTHTHNTTQQYGTIQYSVYYYYSRYVVRGNSIKLYCKHSENDVFEAERGGGERER